MELVKSSEQEKEQGKAKKCNKSSKELGKGVCKKSRKELGKKVWKKRNQEQGKKVCKNSSM